MSNEVLTFDLPVPISYGGGGWGVKESKQVRIKYFEIHFYGWDDESAEMRVFFNLQDWNTERHGLIYEDDKWLAGLRSMLQMAGFSRRAVYDLGYSEQGMQGDGYVSLDVGKSFLLNMGKNHFLYNRALTIGA